MECCRMVLGEVSTNCYLLYDEEERRALIIDPAARQDLIMEKIRELSLKPLAVLLTHGHFDHIMAADELKKRYQIPIYAGKGEKEILADSTRNYTGTLGKKPISMVADIWLSDRELLCLGGMNLLVLATPGHTEGSCCYYAPDEQILFSGDTIFAGNYGRTDLHTGDRDKIAQSIQKLLTELPETVTILPGHGPETTVAEERLENPLSPF